ncbi:biopolymer transporter Tol [Maribacter confluentis]|uniref:Biopolymer transporter Tol n=1 Tax=Maribacter confluentis TaxID=1656093 RepID=A0ABT8RQY1_9FLAO|nr:biopolymer transporter Tol [Maribacter confluentis]MDO1513318.1 biopolymer transporter Tol [Maribacter confluentis]
MKKTVDQILILILSLIFFQNVQAQNIDGKDYTHLANVYNTFDIAGDDIFGQRFLSENYTFKDKVTGVTVNALTTSRHGNSKMYQTHPQWTADGKYIVFTSNRTSKKDNYDSQYYAISTNDFTITQITTGKNGRDFHLGWHKNVAYQFKGNNLIEIDIEQLLNDSETGNVKSSEDYETLLATVPKNIKPSGLGLDASEKAAYFSSKINESLYAIYKVDFITGKTVKLKEVPFWVGHLQANPFVEGELMYCWETRGDSPQRMWYLSIDKNGKVTNRPLYEERKNDWVTHEVFMGPDKVLFHLMGHLDRLQENQTGIYSWNLRTNELKFHGQTGDGGYWHCNATPDGKWIAGDTFDGKLYRINADNPKDTTLLTTGHRLLSKSPFSSEAHMHQSISPDGKWILFNSSLLTKNDIMIVPVHPK